jgi:hypothetical protein
MKVCISFRQHFDNGTQIGWLTASYLSKASRQWCPQQWYWCDDGYTSLTSEECHFNQNHYFSLVVKGRASAIKNCSLHSLRTSQPISHSMKLDPIADGGNHVFRLCQWCYQKCPPSIGRCCLRIVFKVSRLRYYAALSCILFDNSTPMSSHCPSSEPEIGCLFIHSTFCSTV